MEVLTMKKYLINEEYRLNWSDCGDLDLHNDTDWIVTEKDIEELAIGWGKDKAELMEQVTEI